ncbi:hypothetical protein Q8W40_24065 [Vibrio penaeicida]|uniref:hypothetical protein n=1 Tax=Vibrio penaeicida TaxID=104609 RepID=UPI0027344521|nr:hypothetical protein [Vibrio penaeicida]MDP2575294.1 hypothetical protein [Vibrio penaeicida]
MQDIENMVKGWEERHQIRKAMSQKNAESMIPNVGTGDIISTAVAYLGNKVLDGLNAAYENFKKYNVNLLQVTNLTDHYMGSLCFRSEPGSKVTVGAIAPLPVLISKNTSVDAIYEKGLLDSKKDGSAYQWIELSSKKGDIQYTIRLHMTLVSVGSSSQPSMTITLFRNDQKAPLDEVVIEPGGITGIRRLKDTPFSLAAEVTVGASVLTLIEHDA